jgi:predicted metal-binding protein
MKERDVLQRIMKIWRRSGKVGGRSEKEKLKKMEAPATMQKKILQFLLEENFLKGDNIRASFHQWSL